MRVGPQAIGRLICKLPNGAPMKTSAVLPFIWIPCPGLISCHRRPLHSHLTFHGFTRPTPSHLPHFFSLYAGKNRRGASSVQAKGTAQGYASRYSSLVMWSQVTQIPISGSNIVVAAGVKIKPLLGGYKSAAMAAEPLGTTHETLGFAEPQLRNPALDIFTFLIIVI